MSLIPISDLFNFEKGTLQSSKCVPGQYNFITASADWKTHNEYAFDCEALIFAAAASGSLGRTHYIKGKFISSDLCFILTPKDENKYPIDLQFYHIIFNVLKDDIVKNTKAGTSKEAIGLKSFGNYKLPYFDINHQIDVKSKFITGNSIKNNLISEQTHQLDLIKKLRQQILKDAMQGNLLSASEHAGLEDEADYESGQLLLERIKEEKSKSKKKEKALPEIKPEEIPFDIPENWVWCRLGEIADIVRGGSPRPAGDTRYYDGDIPFLKVGDLTGYEGKYCNSYTYTIKKAGLHKTRYVEAGTLMLTNSGATLGIPRICTFPTTFNDGIAAFLDIEDLNKEFLFYFLREKSNYFLKEASRGQGQPNLNTDIISMTSYALPPLSEQKRIVSKIDNLMSLCDKLEASVKSNQDYTNLLYQTALKEALQPPKEERKPELAMVAEAQGEYENTKAVEFKPTNVDYYKRSVLTAEIVWQLHKEPTLGHLKLQKLVYLCQKTADMQLPTNFLRQAMGPYDPQLMRSIDKQLKEKKWFEYQKDQVLKYQPLEKAGQHHNDFLKYFSTESENIQFIIDTCESRVENSQFNVNLICL